MLNPEEYNSLMLQIKELSILREAISSYLSNPQDDETASNRALTNDSMLARWMSELGDIEIDIRKKVVELTPSLPQDFRTPVSKYELKSKRTREK